MHKKKNRNSLLKRVTSLLVTVVMIFSMTSVVLAGSDSSELAAACTGEAGCTAELHVEGCPAMTAPAECTGAEGCLAQTHNEGCPAAAPAPAECTMTEDCPAAEHKEGCPAATPAPAECTMTEDCPATEHKEGCPKAELPVPVVCTGGEDCIADTHESTCVKYMPENPIMPVGEGCTGKRSCTAAAHADNCLALCNCTELCIGKNSSCPICDVNPDCFNMCMVCTCLSKCTEANGGCNVCRDEHTLCAATCTKTEDCPSETHVPGCPKLPCICTDKCTETGNSECPTCAASTDLAAECSGKKLPSIYVDDTFRNYDIGGETMQAAAKFYANETPAQAVANGYGEWIAEFYLSFPNSSGTVNLKNCGVGGVILGFGRAMMIGDADFYVDVSQPIPMVKTLADMQGWSGFQITWETVCSFSDTGDHFECGIVISDELLSDPNFTVGLDLVLTNPDNPNETITLNRITYDVHDLRNERLTLDVGAGRQFTTLEDATSYVLNNKTSFTTGVTYRIYGTVEHTGFANSVCPDLSAELAECNIIGVGEDAKLKLVGPYNGAVNGGSSHLTLSNLELLDGRDMGSFASAWEWSSINVDAANVTVDGCTFNQSGLMVDANATVTGCRFNVTTPSRYNLWVTGGPTAGYSGGKGSGGTVSGNTFTGVRGVKLYYADDITVSGNRFIFLSEKQAVVMDNAARVTIKENIFDHCVGENEGAYESIKSSDTKSSITNLATMKEDNTYIVFEKETLTVTVADKTKTYGESDPEFTGTVLFNAGDQLPDGITVTYSRLAGEDVGTYTITAAVTGEGVENYEITVTDGKLTVDPRAVTVKADDITVKMGDSMPTLTATITGLVGVDTLTVTLNTTAKDTATAGIYDIIATVTGNTENYVVTVQSGKLTVSDLNLDTNGDGVADENVDADGNGIPEYSIVTGKDSQYSKGQSSELKFTGNGTINRFVEVKVDGEVLDDTHYTAVSGSTVVTLKKSYLDTLSLGKHTLTVVYLDGEASCTFTVEGTVQDNTGGVAPDKPEAEKPEAEKPAGGTPGNGGTGTAGPATDVPKTGDGSNVEQWMLLFILSFAGIVTVPFLMRNGRKGRST